MKDKLYFHYQVDCEPLRNRSPACGGPSSWQVSEKTILRFRETFLRYNMVKGAGFYLTPEAAKAHGELFKEMKEEGFEVGVQPNIPGFRFPRYKHDLGYYDEAIQRQIIGEVLEDFEEALGFRPYTYVPCCGSKNEHTYPLLVEFGFRQAMAPVTFRYLPDRPDRCTVGSFPYPHWASGHGLLPGYLPFLVISVTGELSLSRGRLRRI